MMSFGQKGDTMTLRIPWHITPVWMKCMLRLLSISVSVIVVALVWAAMSGCCNSISTDGTLGATSDVRQCLQRGVKECEAVHGQVHLQTVGPLDPVVQIELPEGVWPLIGGPDVHEQLMNYAFYGAGTPEQSRLADACLLVNAHSILEIRQHVDPDTRMKFRTYTIRVVPEKSGLE